MSFVYMSARLLIGVEEGDEVSSWDLRACEACTDVSTRGLELCTNASGKN